MRVTNDHWNIFLDFVDNHPELITNKFSGPNGRENINKMWNEISTKLNCLGFGEKSVSEWKKTIADWKCKTKTKMSQIDRHKSQTGGGGPITMSLSSNEERLLRIMGKSAVFGDGVKEFGVKRHSENISSSCSQQLFSTYQNTTQKKKKVVKKESTASNSNVVLDIDNILVLDEPMNMTHDESDNIEIVYLDHPADIPETHTDVVQKENNESGNQTIMINKTPSRATVNRRINQNLSDNIQNMNNETLAILQNIDMNIGNMSKDLKRLTDAVVAMTNNPK